MGLSLGYERLKRILNLPNKFGVWLHTNSTSTYVVKQHQLQHVCMDLVTPDL
jgi:hypothetical protein